MQISCIFVQAFLQAFIFIIANLRVKLHKIFMHRCKCRVKYVFLLMQKYNNYTHGFKKMGLFAIYPGNVV